MGALTFADARSTHNLAHFYDLSATPRPFQTIPLVPLKFSLESDGGLEAPDDD
jgi:hypothetical protein